MEDHPAFEKAIVRSGLIFLGADVTVVALEAEFRWEFGEPFMHVHFNPVVLAALFVRWLEGATVSRAGESEELVEAVAEATERAVGAVNRTVRPACLATVGFVLADDLLWDFNEAVENVADRTSKFPCGSIVGTRRRLDIRYSETAEGDKGSSYKKEFFHA